MHVSVAILIAVVTLVSMCSGTNPGLKIQFSKAGINYVNKIAVDLLIKELQGKPIPDQHGEASVKIGHIKYDVTGMKITRLVKPNTDVQFSSGMGATWRTSGGSISLHGDWRYKAKVAFIPIRDHGSFDVSVRDMRFSLSFNFGLDGATGRPTVKTTSCSADIRNLDIHIHGGASWLYNLFKHSIEKMLTKALNKLLCKAATKAVDVNGEKALAKLKVDTRIGPDLSLDYRLVEKPKFDANHLTSFHKTMKTSVASTIKDNKLTGELKDTHLKVQVLKSALKTPVKILDKALRLTSTFMMKDFVIPQLNGIGKKGLPIPSLDNVHFTNIKLTLGSHAIRLETDVDYNPNTNPSFEDHQTDTSLKFEPVVEVDVPDSKPGSMHL